MNERSAVILAAVVTLLAVAHSVWRYYTARGIAEDWLRRHRYRTRSLRLGWFGFMRFAPKLFRNEDRAVRFRAEVDDMSLGGTGVVWLRVWTDWLGLQEREPEVSWERMPVTTDGGSRSLDDRLADAQLAVLALVAAGETVFPTRERGAAAGADIVEHVLALGRRGLVTSDAPVLRGRGEAQATFVSNVAITELGQEFLAARRSERR